jgi:hypothetical protein
MTSTSPETFREPRRWRRAVLITAGALAAVAAVAACGDPSAPRLAAGSTTTIRSSGGSTQGTGLLAYSSCMRSHDVPSFPDPSGTAGIPKQEVISAFQQVSNSQADVAQIDCRHLLPPGGSLGGQDVQPVTAEDQQDYLKAAACMRSHGITNFPDPTFSGSTVNLHIPSGIDTNSIQFARARRTCERLIPAGLPYSASSG